VSREGFHGAASITDIDSAKTKGKHKVIQMISRPYKYKYKIISERKERKSSLTMPRNLNGRPGLFVLNRIDNI